ncbi:MAG: hypothetical protein L7F77_06240 [Candidatus Magnetominusculus sp. LBB02]|nr:hypothetical protein [Candidatus Magnetominusculus sp. LBB02]
MDRKYPSQVEINGDVYQYEKILKDDFFSVNVLYINGGGIRYVLKLSDFRFIFGLLLRPLAVFFSRREYAIYKRTGGIEGIPPLGPRFGMRGYFHYFAEGTTLHQFKGELPANFFDGLLAIIKQLHQRRIFYLDLNKLGNIIVGDDMRPYLIDFQVSIYFRPLPGFLGRIGDKIFNSLIREDIYHIYKHKKRFQPHLMTADETSLAVRTGFNSWYNRLWGAPYRKVKRLIYPSGSNEIVWYKWKKLKDKDKRMP